MNSKSENEIPVEMKNRRIKNGYAHMAFKSEARVGCAILGCTAFRGPGWHKARASLGRIGSLSIWRSGGGMS